MGIHAASLSMVSSVRNAPTSSIPPESSVSSKMLVGRGVGMTAPRCVPGVNRVGETWVVLGGGDDSDAVIQVVVIMVSS